MDHLWIPGGASGEFPELAKYEKAGPFGPQRPDGIYVIRFRNTKDGPRSKRFLRGYGFQGGGSMSFNMNAPGFGAAFKKSVHDPVVGFNLVGFGECLPYFDNYVELDPGVRDVYGIPVLRSHMSWRDNEKKMIPDMTESACEMLAAAGARDIRPFQVMDRVPGYGIHEMGVARMGKDKKTSVLNQYQQTHDVQNLFVMDAAGFTSGACQNPTLTIMALAVRSTDYLLAEMKRGNV